MGDEAIERGSRGHAGGEITSNNLNEEIFESLIQCPVVNEIFGKLDLVVTKNFMFVMLEGTRN